MKKMTFRKMALSALIVGFTGVVGASVAALKAGADSINNYVAKTVSETTITMAKGASARINSDNNNGLRWTMQLSKSDYEGLKWNYHDNISFGIIIAPADYEETYGEINAETVFGASAVYDWATYEDGEWVYGGNKTRVINLSTTTMTPETAGSENYVLYGTVSGLDEANYAREFVGVGYVSYLEDDTTKYLFLERDDNIRSMAYVAQVYQTLDTISAEDKAYVLSTYVTGKADQETTYYNVRHMLSDGNGNYVEATEAVDEVDAYINGQTTAPTSKTFDGYMFDSSNENNSTGGETVYANGKTSVYLYYSNDYNYNMVKNADGSYSTTTAGRVWSMGPAWAYHYTSTAPATTAVYSVTLEASAALRSSLWGQSATGIIVTQGERVLDEDLTFNEWAGADSMRTVKQNSLYGSLFGASCIASKDVQIFSNRGMGCGNIGDGSMAKLSDTKNSLKLTLVLYKNVFYVYVDDTYVGSRNVNDAGNWNGLAAAYATPSGETYAYSNDVGFRFGVGNYNNETDVKFTVEEVYGDDALLTIQTEERYKMLLNEIKGAAVNVRVSEFKDTTTSATVVYSVKVQAPFGLPAVSNPSGHIGVAIAPKTDTTQVLTLGFSQFGITSAPSWRRWDSANRWDFESINTAYAFKNLSNATATLTEGILTIVIYGDKLYVYAGATAETFVRGYSILNTGELGMGATYSAYTAGQEFMVGVGSSSIGTAGAGTGVFVTERTRLYGTEAIAYIQANYSANITVA